MKYKTRKMLASIIALACALLLILTFCTFPALAETAEAPVPAVTIDLTQICVSIITFVLSIILAWIAKVIVPPIAKWIGSKTTTEQQNYLINLIHQLVKAAEQVIGAGHGAEKMQQVQEELRKRGYTVDISLIEAAVHDMNTDFLSTVITAAKQAQEEDTDAE